MKVRITRPPTGLINGVPWADVEEIDLPDHTAAEMVAAGAAEAVAVKPAERAEKRPASAAGVEARKRAKKA